jgi:hypothetical protein
MCADDVEEEDQIMGDHNSFFMSSLSIWVDIGLVASLTKLYQL